MAPQIIWISLMLIGLGGGLAKHGEPKTGTHNIVSDLIIASLVAGLLYWGGFFAPLLGVK